ncbi:MAG: DUF2695 domain-containing protein [Planctomycetota bacterium]|jgi:hypothetical protein
MMTPEDPKWDEFVKRLEGPEGVNFRRDPEGGEVTWDCYHNFRNSAAVLASMGIPAEDIEATFEFFVREGAYCDCEVLLNLTV